MFLALIAWLKPDTIQAEPLQGEPLVFYLQEGPGIREPIVIPPKPKPIKKGNLCSCVLWAKAQTGFTQSIGNASNWPVNSQTPQIGAVVVWKGIPGHVGIIASLEGNLALIRDANHSPCRYTERLVDLSTQSIKGYWIQT